MTKKDIEKQIKKSGWASLTQKQKDIYSAKEDLREILYEEAIRCLGRDVSPKENEYGCAESVNTIFMFAFGEPIGGGASTALMYQALQDTKRFKKVLEPLRGDIVISPTGYSKFKGKKLTIKNGHVGIVSDSNEIMSNDSKTSLWKKNYTWITWEKRYQDKGGYPMDFYRVLS